MGGAFGPWSRPDTMMYKTAARITVTRTTTTTTSTMIRATLVRFGGGGGYNGGYHGASVGEGPAGEKARGDPAAGSGEGPPIRHQLRFQPNIVCGMPEALRPSRASQP